MAGDDAQSSVNAGNPLQFRTGLVAHIVGRQMEQRPAQHTLLMEHVGLSKQSTNGIVLQKELIKSRKELTGRSADGDIVAEQPPVTRVK